MNVHLRALRPFDIAAALLAVVLTVAAALAAYGDARAPSHVHVETQIGGFVYDLGADVLLEFDGPIGTTVVEIADGRVRVVSSPCREQICVNAGFLESSGDWTACLPNRVFLEVTGNEDPEVDAVSY